VFIIKDRKPPPDTHHMRSITVITLSVIALSSVGWSQTNPYFPLQTGNRWTLKHSTGATFRFEVTSAGSGTAEMTATGPWGASILRFTESGSRYELTGYGSPGAVQVIPPGLPFFDFTANASIQWSNALGQFSASKLEPRAAGGYAYVNCYSVTHTSGGGAFTYVFSDRIGLIEYRIGTESFFLDPAESRLWRSGTLVEPWLLESTPSWGVLPNVLASQSDTASAAQARFNLLNSNGVRFLLTYGNWPELEPQTGKFNVESVKYLVNEASKRNWTIAYTLGLIDMDKRRLPADLAKLAWDHPEMERRLLLLIDKITAEFKGRVKWVQIGNEVDTYLDPRPSEVAAYAKLVTAAKARFQQRVPGLKVSVTFKFQAMNALASTYQPLDTLCDHLTLTYGPHTPEYRALPPSAIGGEVVAMLKAARSRKILMQEFAYPSAVDAGSSTAQQAEAMRHIVRQLRMISGQVEAVQVFLLGDLSTANTNNLAYSFGMYTPTFTAYLGSLGLYTTSGTAKPAFNALAQEAMRQ
jgi:hypothetical protein